MSVVREQKACQTQLVLRCGRRPLSRACDVASEALPSYLHHYEKTRHVQRLQGLSLHSLQSGCVAHLTDNRVVAGRAKKTERMLLNGAKAESRAWVLTIATTYPGCIWHLLLALHNLQVLIIGSLDIEAVDERAPVSRGRRRAEDLHSVDGFDGGLPGIQAGRHHTTLEHRLVNDEGVGGRSSEQPGIGR